MSLFAAFYNVVFVDLNTQSALGNINISIGKMQHFGVVQIIREVVALVVVNALTLFLNECILAYRVDLGQAASAMGPKDNGEPVLDPKIRPLQRFLHSVMPPA